MELLEMEVRSTRTIDVPGMNCDDDDDKEEKFEDIDQLSPLEEFGQDVMNTMLSFLYLDEFQTLSTVSKRMNDAVTYTSHIHMSDAAIPQSQHVQQQQQQHRRSEAHLTEDGLRKLLRRFRSLNVLTLYGLAPVGDHLFSILNESPTAHTLHRLSLHGCCLSYWCPTTLQLQNLTHVTVTGGSIRVAFGSFFASSSDHLQSLSIGQCSSLRDENVTDMVVGLQDQLQQLTLHQCLRVKKPTLRFSRLTQLNLLGCFSLSDLPDFDCPSLTLLVLSFCFQLDGSVIQRVVNRLPQLEHLGLVKCPGLIRLELTHNPLLQRLNVSLSNNLQYLQLHCPKLVQLEVRNNNNNNSLCAIYTVPSPI